MEGQLASEYAYSKGVHYSVFRLPSGRLQSLQDWVATRDERARMHPEELDIMRKKVASRLLQTLRECHAEQHYLGAIASERILVEPVNSLLDLTQGKPRVVRPGSNHHLFQSGL
ncbi:hypothetical protein WJX82_007084 [Trebouxia sp. C0006]